VNRKKMSKNNFFHLSKQTNKKKKRQGSKKASKGMTSILEMQTIKTSECKGQSGKYLQDRTCW